VRRPLATLLCLVSVAIVAAGCGSGGGSSNANSPLDEALGYLPKTAPFAVAIETDPNSDQWKSLVANLKKFPFTGQVQDQLNNSLRKAGFDYDKDIKPLLGNEAVIGSPTLQDFLANNSRVVAAIQVKDKGKLEDLLSGNKDLTKDGSSNGATLYKSNDGTELAQNDDVVVFADTKQAVTAALQQHERDDRLTEDTFNSSLSGLNTNALARVYFNVQELINGDPSTTAARKVKWVAALRTFGLTASSENDGIAVDFNLKTDSSQLQDSDLPIATGDQSPPVSGKPGELAFAIRGLDQTERFAESVAQTISPSSYGDFQQAKATIGKQIGIDVDKDLIGQLSGNTIVTLDINGHFAARSEPKDPTAFATTLRKFSRVAAPFAQGAGLPNAKLTRVRGLYKLSGSNGKTYYYGMVGKVFVVSNQLSRLAQLAAESPAAVPGAKGAIAINTDAGKLVAQIIQQAAGGGLGGAFGGSLITGPLGNLTGSVASSTSGLTGHMKLAIK
jgi:Protein of unknown function (DUF3352)